VQEGGRHPRRAGGRRSEAADQTQPRTPGREMVGRARQRKTETPGTETRQKGAAGTGPAGEVSRRRPHPRGRCPT